MRIRTLIFTVAVTAVMLAACGGESSTTPEAPAPAVDASPDAAVDASPDAAALLKDRCTACHTLDKVNNYKPEGSWLSLVERMAGKPGADIAAEDVAPIAKYLDKAHPGA